MEAIESVQGCPRRDIEVHRSIESPRISPRKVFDSFPNSDSLPDTGEFKLVVRVCVDRTVKVSQLSNGDFAAYACAGHATGSWKAPNRSASTRPQ